MTKPKFNFATITTPDQLFDHLKSWSEATKHLHTNEADKEAVVRRVSSAIGLFMIDCVISNKQLRAKIRRTYQVFRLKVEDVEVSTDDFIPELERLDDIFPDGYTCHEPHQAIGFYLVKWQLRCWRHQAYLESFSSIHHGEAAVRLCPAVFPGLSTPDEASAKFRQMVFGFYQDAVKSLTT